MKADEVICNCLNITNGMIKEAVDAGATTLDEVTQATGAGSICGACLDEVEKAVKHFVAERK